MQLIAEAYDLLRTVYGLDASAIADIFDEWMKGDLDSYLIEITSEVLDQVDARTGQPLIDVIVDAAGQKGTGTWTAQIALELGVDLNAIAESVFARSISSSPELRAALQPLLQGPDQTITVEDRDAFVEDVRQALWASKVVAYSQGLDLIRVGAKEYGWDIDVAAVAKLWRAGCIIRAKLLDRISNEYAANSLTNLLEAPSIVEDMGTAQAGWRRTLTRAIEAGVAAPVFSSALAYYDSARSPRLPAFLTQGQRDFFGAHTYKRIDEDGAFHTEWSADRSETRIS
jgi:6-phosphogluconate dehydrogenase